jgi:hypothetical protein
MCRFTGRGKYRVDLGRHYWSLHPLTSQNYTSYFFDSQVDGYELTARRLDNQTSPGDWGLASLAYDGH